MDDQFKLTQQFWDQVFPVRKWTFMRSLELQNTLGYDDKLVAKSMSVYCRMDEILRMETKNVIGTFL